MTSLYPSRATFKIFHSITPKALRTATTSGWVFTLPGVFDWLCVAVMTIDFTFIMSTNTNGAALSG